MTTTHPEEQPALVRARSQLLARWRAFPYGEELDTLLRAALDQADASTPELITVTSPVSRTQRLRLAALSDAVSLDSFYNGEAAELAVASSGRCYLVYRRKIGRAHV